MNRDELHHALYSDVEHAQRALERAFGPLRRLPTGPPAPRWQWRQVPFGRCPRCHWPANTLGPDGQPWHAFCWGNPDPPSGFSEWMRRKVEAGTWGQR
jgi:hypothetical protein